MRLVKNINKSRSTRSGMDVSLYLSNSSHFIVNKFIAYHAGNEEYFRGVYWKVKIHGVSCGHESGILRDKNITTRHENLKNLNH